MPSTPYQTSTSLVQGEDAVLLTVPIFAMSAVADANELVDFVPGFDFEVLNVDHVTVTPITTGSKTTTCKPYIDGVVVPGCSLVVAGTKAKGVVTNGTAASGTKLYGTSTSKLTLTCSSTTAFVEGAGYWVVKLRKVKFL